MPFDQFNPCARFIFSIPVCLASLFMGCLLQTATAGEIVLSGVFQGKNLFVQNPLSPDNQTYCVEEVYVNEVRKMSGIRHSAFEIDLSHLEVQDAVTIRIISKDGCIPKIINPQVLRPSNSFGFGNIAINTKSLDWSTTGESPKYIYYAEHFVNGSWLAIKKFGARNTGAGIYSLPVTHHLGENKYRVKAQNNETHHILYSRIVIFHSKEEPVTFYPKNVTGKITLSRAVSYEILDSKGKVLKKGRGTEINLTGLKTGVYYLNFGNRTEKFFKK